MRPPWSRRSPSPKFAARPVVHVGDVRRPASPPARSDAGQPEPRSLWSDPAAGTPKPFAAGTITSIPSPPDPFEHLVRAALDELPAQFVATLESVPVVISDDGERFGAYGLYHGASIAHPGVPAQIFIFRDTLWRDFGHDPQRLAEQVRRVVRHELGHHLGFDEPGVQRLGL